MLAVFLLASWFGIEWTDAGSDSYSGGLVITDDAGEVLRVTLGPGDVDCRPSYSANREDWIVKALVAAEDGAFWTHHGVRPLSILRAVCQNLFYRRRISGASTISMQAVRLIRPHPKNLWWKWKEAILAVKMERQRSKEWILSQYLNRAPYGSNFIGIEAAAQGWFGKGAKELGLAEAAMLAGMVQAPSRFRPDRGYEKAFKRREYVLGRMLELGYINEEQFEGARDVRPVVCRAPRPFKAPFFCDWVLRERGFNRETARQSGKIATGLNAELQRQCENAVNAAARDGGYSVAAVIMRADSGEIKAFACSGDYFNPTNGQVNTACALRPAGSTLKPLLTALAMDRGFCTMDYRINDAATSFKGYRPANFDAKYRGLVTVRDALVMSLNIPFVKMLQAVGVEGFADHLRELGFRGVGDVGRYGLGMAIGNVEVSLIELVRAYREIARGGGAAYSPGTAYLVSEALSGGERAQDALDHIADVRVPRFAWKTGTSSAYRDAWTIAWNPQYVVGVWCGHQVGGFGDKTLVGVKAAAPVAWRLVRTLYPQNSGPWYFAPTDVEPCRVCKLTGKIATPDCAETEDGRIVAGRSPRRLCDRHRRDVDGNVVTLALPEARLAIAKPEDGTVFETVDARIAQKIVCRPNGNGDGVKVWWFLDGELKGESVGNESFTLDHAEGAHTLTCATGDGHSASVTFTCR